MVPVTIYTRNGCPYCVAAVNLFEEKGRELHRVQCQHQSRLPRRDDGKSGRNTFPQVFVGSTHVGGCDDLHALDARGGLEPLLNG